MTEHMRAFIPKHFSGVNGHVGNTPLIRLHTRTDLLPFARGSQSAVEELGNGAVGADPTAPAEQVMNFRRDD